MAPPLLQITRTLAPMCWVPTLWLFQNWIDPSYFDSPEQANLALRMDRYFLDAVNQLQLKYHCYGIIILFIKEGTDSLFTSVNFRKWNLNAIVSGLVIHRVFFSASSFGNSVSFHHHQVICKSLPGLFLPCHCVGSFRISTVLYSSPYQHFSSFCHPRFASIWYPNHLFL